MPKFTFRRTFTDPAVSEALKAFPNFYKDMPTSSEALQEMQSLPLPRRKTLFSAGYDIEMPYTVTIDPAETVSIYLGFTLEDHCVCVNCDCSCSTLLLPRSSLFKKKGLLKVGNFEYLVDEPAVLCLINATTVPVTLEKGEAVAQLVLTDFRKRSPIKAEFVGEDASEGSYQHLLAPDALLFQASSDILIPPGEFVMYFTGVKSEFAKDHLMLLQLEEEIRARYNVCMTNYHGVVDSDYYNNSGNEGNIGFQLYNLGYVSVLIPKGTVIGKGLVLPYYTVEEEVPPEDTRVGGYGSTDAGCATCEVTPPVGVEK